MKRTLILILVLALLLAACGEIAGYPTHNASGKLVCPSGQVLDILDTGVPVCRYQ